MIAPAAAGMAHGALHFVLPGVLDRLTASISRAMESEAASRDITGENGIALAIEYGVPHSPSLHRADRERAERFPSPRRRAQFLLGRAAANRALTALTGSPSESIAQGPYGEPQWPPGFTGSIAHAGSCAVCVVTHAVRGSIGVDIEPIRRIDPDWIIHVSSASEHRMLEVACGDAEVAFYLGFVLKEAAIKTLRPARGSLNFRSIVLSRARRDDGGRIASEWRFGDRGGMAYAAAAAGMALALSALGELTEREHGHEPP